MSDAQTPQESNIPIQENTEIQENQAVENTEENQDLEAAPEAPKADKKVVEEAKKIEKKLKKLKLKVDGKEIEEEFDLDNDEYLTNQFQLAKVAKKRMSEAAELEKEVRYFINELKSNPRKVLSDPNIGIDIKQLAASIIEEEIANSQKTPEQLEREKLEAELKAIKEEREKEKEELKSKEMQRLQEQAYINYDTMISKALESSDLPKKPYVVKKMADYMLMGLDKGLDVTPQDVLPLVRDEIMNDLKEMIDVMSEDVVEQFIGKDILNKFRKKNLAKAKQAPPTPLSKAVQETGKKSDQENKEVKKKMSYKDYFKI